MKNNTRLYNIVLYVHLRYYSRARKLASSQNCILSSALLPYEYLWEMLGGILWVGRGSGHMLGGGGQRGEKLKTK